MLVSKAKTRLGECREECEWGAAGGVGGAGGQIGSARQGSLGTLISHVSTDYLHTTNSCLVLQLQFQEVKLIMTSSFWKGSGWSR